MNPELDRCHSLFASLETERISVLADLDKWPPDRVSFRPTPGAWSAVEVLDHIVRAETGTTSVLRSGLRNPKILGTGPRPGIAALDRALRSQNRFQVPSGAEAIHPDAATTLPEVSNRWQLARTGLHLLLNDLTESDTHVGIFHHPFAGWMTFAEVLTHFSAHLLHHGFQLARLQATVEP